MKKYEKSFKFDYVSVPLILYFVFHSRNDSGLKKIRLKGFLIILQPIIESHIQDYRQIQLYPDIWKPSILF